MPTSPAEAADEFSYGQRFPFCQVNDQCVPRFCTLDLVFVGEVIWQLPIELKFVRGYTQCLRELGECIFRSDELIEFLILGQGLLQILMCCEDRLGELTGEFLPTVRRAGLDTERIDLRRAWDIEGPGDFEEAPFVAERMDLGIVSPGPGLLVRQDRVSVPALPKSLDDVEELFGALISGLVSRGLVEAEVPRGLGAGCGDDVPSDPSPADVVDGGEAPCQVVGAVVARRSNGDESDARWRQRARPTESVVQGSRPDVALPRPEGWSRRQRRSSLSLLFRLFGPG